MEAFKAVYGGKAGLGVACLPRFAWRRQVEGENLPACLCRARHGRQVHGGPVGGCGAFRDRLERDFQNIENGCPEATRLLSKPTRKTEDGRIRKGYSRGPTKWLISRFYRDGTPPTELSLRYLDIPLFLIFLSRIVASLRFAHAMVWNNFHGP